MKKLILSIMLTLLSVSVQLYAQEAKSRWHTANNAEARFKMIDGLINHRHIVWFKNGNSIIITLSNYKSYNYFANMDSVLSVVRENIHFAYDSARRHPTHNFLISYTNSARESSTIMFKDYAPAADFFWSGTDDQLKPLKVEYDTLNILFKSGPDQGQATFILNKLSDIDSLLASKGFLNGVIDTMRTLAKPNTVSKEKGLWNYQSSVFWYHDAGKYRKPTFLKNTLGYPGEYIEHQSFIRPLINIGAGILRDKIAPVADLGLECSVSNNGYSRTSTILGLYMSGYFVFERGSDNHYSVRDNWFINAEIGEKGINNFSNYVKTQRLTVGIGYLVRQNGNYFEGTTMKAFMNFTFKGGITLSPEVIATNNFRQVFPGLTLKVF